MNVAKNEMLFIYNSNDLLDRSALAYASASSSDLQLKELDLVKDPLTERQLAQVAQRLELPVKKLVREHLLPADYSELDLTKMLVQNPHMMKTPIAVYHDRAQLVDSAYEFVKKSLRMKHSEVEDPGDTRGNNQNNHL